MKPADAGTHTGAEKPDDLSKVARGGPTSKNSADRCLAEEQLKKFRDKIRGSKNVTDDVADELSAAMGLAERIRSHHMNIPSAGDQIDFIIDCLLLEKPLLAVARDERMRLQLETYQNTWGLNRLLAKVSSGSSVGLLLLALVVSFVFWVLVTIVIWGVYNFTHITVAKDMFFMNSTALAVITSAAFVGGVVSIATRLREFARVRDLDPIAMLATAVLKPLIGVVLSVFILAALEGGVITFGLFDTNAFTSLDRDAVVAKLRVPAVKTAGDDKTKNATGDKTKNATGEQTVTDEAVKSVIDSIVLSQKTLYILWIFGFLAGFSERFAWDFVDRAQGAVSGAGDKDKPKAG